MPNVLSRFATDTLGLRILPAECHELSHLWHPNCFRALWEPFIPSWLFCLKTYGTLYTLKALVDRKGRADRVDWARVLANTARSSAFLTTTEILFMFWLCFFRRLLGFATWPTVSWLNAFAACAITIWIESKPRRGMLVPYMLNLASEAVFRQAQHRHWPLARRPLPFGASLLFGASIGASVALLARSSGAKSARSAASLSSVLRMSHGIGPDPNLLRRRPSIVCGSGGQQIRHWGCAQKAFKLALKNFSLSLGGLTVLKLFQAVKAISRKKTTTTSSSSTSSIFSTLRLPAFLATLPLLCQLSQCLCAGLLPSRVSTFGQSLGAGLSSALAMSLFWPNNTLALYAFWKMVELGYFRLADARLVPVLPWADALLFCVVASYLLGIAVLEPQALRPSYYKFLCALTGNRIQQFNRPLFDRFFGTHSCSILHQDYRPSIPPHLRTMNPGLYLPPVIA